MDYIKLWSKYLEIKRNFEGKSFSRNTNIRQALLEGNHKVILKNYRKIYLTDRDSGGEIKTLSQLLLTQPCETDIKCDVLVLDISRSTNGDCYVSSRTYNKIPLGNNEEMKEIQEEVFWYLWEKTEDGIEKLFLGLRLITPSVINKSTHGNSKRFERLFEKAGIKLVPIPEDITDLDIFDSLFIFEGNILYTNDTYNYLKTLREDKVTKGLNTDSVDRLLRMWTPNS